MDKLVQTLRILGLGLAVLTGAAPFQGCIHKTAVPREQVGNELVGMQEPKQRREGVDTILVLLPAKRCAQDVFFSLNDEIANDFDVFVHIVNNETTVEEIGRKIEKVKPNCLFLMNNQTVKLYKEYQESKPQQTPFPPSIVVMTSYLGQIYQSIEKATGIAYEIPEVSVFVNLRMFLDRPINRVGVVYRTPFENYLNYQASFAKREKIETVTIDVGLAPSPDDVRKAIHHLVAKHNVDALWVLNDNVLLAGEQMVQSGWMQGLQGSPIPVVVGAENLVNKDIHFGAFAMVPDHGRLGVQAADIVYELYENGWELGSRKIEQPVSVKTVVDIKLVREAFQFREDMINRIDVLVE